jgi:predicted nicotinamide N-methyase
MQMDFQIGCRGRARALDERDPASGGRTLFKPRLRHQKARGDVVHVTPVKSEDFICANTVVDAPKLVPEIRLHLATELTPLWHATESYMNQININAPFWAFAWVGGQALARYILDNPESVVGLNVVDIGSGGGIVSIAAVLAGAEHVTALDFDPLAAAVCRLNAQLNGTADRITTETANAITYDFAPFDLILVGDVCYTRGESADLTHRLKKATTPVLFGDPGRQFLPRQGIRQIATYTVETSRELEADAITEASIWRMVRPQP